MGISVKPQSSLFGGIRRIARCQRRSTAGHQHDGSDAGIFREIADSFGRQGGFIPVIHYDQFHGITVVKQWVQMDRAKDHPLTEWAPRVHGAIVHFFTHQFTEFGSLGSPTKATQELGNDLKTIAIQELEQAIRWLDEKEY